MENQSNQSATQGTNPNQIKNPQTGQLPRVKGPEMNERDFLNDILATEKYLTDSFNVFAREASNQVLHKIAVKILNDSHVTGRNLFNLMFRKGWYALTAAGQQEITQLNQQFANYRSQEPYQQQ